MSDSKNTNYPDPKSLPVIAIGLIGAVVIYLHVIGLDALFRHQQRQELIQKVETQTYDDFRRVRMQQLEGLNSYSWVDKEKGRVAIPIDRAMALFVQEHHTSSKVGKR